MKYTCTLLVDRNILLHSLMMILLITLLDVLILQTLLQLLSTSGNKNNYSVLKRIEF